jgi:hypothetical protein
VDTREAKRIFVIVWLILSVGAAALLSALYVLPENTILELSRLARLPNHGDHACPFCGMTRAFLAISNGDPGRAASLNRGALPLCASLVLNEALAALYCARRSWAAVSIRRGKFSAAVFTFGREEKECRRSA